MSQTSLPVEEFTTPDPITATETMSIDRLNELLHENGVRHLPVLRGKKVVGIISERDLRVLAGFSDREKVLVVAGDIMARDPVTVNASDSLDQVALQMSEKKIGSVIVNDENDQFLGIFTATDALNALIEIARGNKS